MGPDLLRRRSPAGQLVASVLSMVGFRYSTVNKRLKLVALIALLICAGLLTGSQWSPFSQSRVSPATADPIPDDYFGMTMHFPLTTPWPSIPFATLRTWDVIAWADIHKGPGVYDWSKLDPILAIAHDHGIDIVFTLGLTPQWASANPTAPTPYGPGQCAPPSNIQYWDDFVQAIVSHARGRIKYWEVWNEPQNPEFYCGDIATMATLQQHAYRIVKSIDPSLLVLTPSPVNVPGPRWMARFLAAGGGQYADIMAFHGYLDYPDVNAESVAEIITRFTSVFAAHGQGLKPVWDTEANWGQASWLPDPDLQAAFLAKFYLLHWSTGVRRAFWYAYENDTWGTLWDHASGLRKPGIAYNEVHKWMTGAVMSSPCAKDGAVWTCHFSRLNGYQAIAVWSSAAGSSAYIVPRQYRQYRDLSGKIRAIADRIVPITNKPVLVETASAF